MRTAGIGRWLTVASAFWFVSGQAVAAPSPQEVLNKAMARMTGARTYQATYVMTSPRGTQTMQLKSVTKKKQSLTITPPGIQVIDDGKTMVMYNKAANAYGRMPSQVAGASSIVAAQLAAMERTSSMKFGAPTKIGGASVLVIEVTPKQPGGATAKLYIEQGSYRLLKVVDQRTMPGVGGQKGQTLSQTISITNEKVNAPIPDSAFKFTPPPGAKEMAAPAPGAMGGPRR
jgi:outer membrane lipoprotein-sorting protein